MPRKTVTNPGRLRLDGRSYRVSLLPAEPGPATLSPFLVPQPELPIEGRRQDVLHMHW